MIRNPGIRKRLKKDGRSRLLMICGGDFEEKIGHPDVEGMYDSAYSMVDTMPMEGIIDTMNVYWREQYGFVDKLQKYVLEWLQTIDTSQAMCKKDSLINNRNDLFMSFNTQILLKRFMA